MTAHDNEGAERFSGIPVGMAHPGLVRFSQQSINPTWVGFVEVEEKHVRCLVKGLDHRQLVNEIFCAAIAKVVGIPVPDCFLVLVDPNEIEYEAQIHAPDGKAVLFGSEMKGINSAIVEYGKLRGSSNSKKIVDWLANSGKIGDVYAFDEHCANTDRHAGNVLISPSSELWLIDHGHCMTGPNWQANDLVPNQKCVSRLSEWCSPYLSAPQKTDAARAVAGYGGKAREVNYVGFARYLERLGLLEGSDSNALSSFAERRIQHVPSMVSTSLGHPVAA
ncbi:hypothetical protein FKB34_04795 [Glycocaulis profundi]|nr:hypothetical protein FKB34_04795 [Glycocaulis profundi]